MLKKELLTKPMGGNNVSCKNPRPEKIKKTLELSFTESGPQTPRY